MRRSILFRLKETMLIISYVFKGNNRYDVKDRKDLNNILVLFTPVIGDTILYLNVLRVLCTYFHNKKMKCNIVTLKQNETLISSYCSYDKVFTFDYLKFVNKKDYRRKFLQEINENKYDKIINPYFDNLITADLLAKSVKAFEKIAANRNKVYFSRILGKYSLKNLLRSKAYNQFIDSYKSRMDFMKQSSFMEQINIDSFKARISYIPTVVEWKPISNKEYCIIAPGASKTGKRWEVIKFGKIIEYIIEKSHLEVFVCGSSREERIFNEIKKCINKDIENKVINYIGKTSLLEYIEVIRNARFIISNDSSPIHISASVGTPSICIIGGWDYLRLLPYEIEVQDNRTIEPRVVSSEYMKCFNCFDYHVGYKNKTCKRCVKSGKPYPCISAISEDKVISVIDSVLAK